MNILFTVLVIIGVFFIITFTIYWFNLDMKLVRKIYDALWKHYDKMKRDRRL